MKDLEFEQKSSLTRLEAADRLSALAHALRHGGQTALDLGPGTLSVRIPDELRTEVEIEVGDGHIELEIELQWPIATASPGGAGAGGVSELNPMNPCREASTTW